VETTDEDEQTAYPPQLLSATDYFPFGMQMPGRVVVEMPEGYRYGFNGMEKENAVNEDGYTTQFRKLDTWSGRWLSLDPEMLRFPSKSPYMTFSNNPIIFIDPKGDADYYCLKGTWLGTDGQEDNKVFVITAKKVQKQIVESSLAGKEYKIPVVEGNDVLRIPTGKVLEAVKLSYEKTIASGNVGLEHGGHKYSDEDDAVNWDPGEPAEFKNGKLEASVKAFFVEGRNLFPSSKQAPKLEFWWHSHPNTEYRHTEPGYETQTLTLGYSSPSDEDIRAARILENRGFKGNSFILGTRSETVGFFNSKNPNLGKMKYSDFVKTGENLKGGATYEQYIQNKTD
jgi:RHS repeat-associated protein